MTTDTTPGTYVESFDANRSRMAETMRAGHYRRTGHELSGYYVTTADAGIVSLVRTCPCCRS